MCALGLPTRRGSAIDFGCGVGRVTGPISAHFQHCLGVDFSPAMVSRARELWAGRPGLHFEQLGATDLSSPGRPPFDLVYSRLVLQHLPSHDAIRDAVRTLCRLLAPGGLLILQIPSRITLRKRIQLRSKAYRVLRRMGCSPAPLLARGIAPISMRGLNVEEVLRLISACGCRALEAEPDDAGGPGIESRTYYATTAPRSEPIERPQAPAHHSGAALHFSGPDDPRAQPNDH